MNNEAINVDVSRERLQSHEALQTAMVNVSKGTLELNNPTPQWC